MSLFEGDFQMRAVKPEFGAASGKPKVRIEFEVVDGPHVGKRAAYDGKLDEKNIKYTKRDMITCGWQGKDVSTFVDDVIKAAKVLPCRVEIVRWENPETGKLREWTAVRSIGFAAKPLEQLDKDKVKDVNDWFANAESLEPATTGAKSDDIIPF